MNMLHMKMEIGSVEKMLGTNITQEQYHLATRNSKREFNNVMEMFNEVKVINLHQQFTSNPSFVIILCFRGISTNSGWIWKLWAVK